MADKKSKQEKTFSFDSQIGMGSTVQCRVTGFKGKVTAIQFSLAGCVRYCVQPPIDKDGKLAEAYYFDEGNLEVLDEVPVLKSVNQNRGGPMTKRPTNGL